MPLTIWKVVRYALEVVEMGEQKEERGFLTFGLFLFAYCPVSYLLPVAPSCWFKILAFPVHIGWDGEG